MVFDAKATAHAARTDVLHLVLGYNTALLNAFKLDRAAPTLSAPTLQGPLGEDGLHYRGPVTVTLAASDDLSGLSAIHYQIEADPVVTVLGPS